MSAKSAKLAREAERGQVSFLWAVGWLFCRDATHASLLSGGGDLSRPESGRAANGNFYTEVFDTPEQALVKFEAEAAVKKFNEQKIAGEKAATTGAKNGPVEEKGSLDVGGSEMSKNNIPSDEEFARVKAAMRKQDHGLSQVRDRILKQFRERGVHEFFVLFSGPTSTFGAYVFYRLDEEVAKGDDSGLAAEIRDAVLEELAAAGRVERDTLDVRFEFDSHENIERNFEGDYYNRLR